MKYMYFVLAAILFSTVVGASITIPKEVTCDINFTLPECPNDPRLDDQNVSMIIDEVNKNLDKIPDIFVSLFGNERMTVYVDDLTYAVITQDNKLVSVNMGEAEDKTMNVYVSRNTLKDIAVGNIDPVDALNQGLIKYEGVGFVSSIKWTFINVVSGIVGFFANLFG